jgi:DNA-binding HxlR family transcriptional regulator
MLVMAGRRKYDDGCAVSHALDLIGERWALLIVRELLLGPKRFTDLRAGVPGASPDVLAQRLRELKDAGVVRQRKLPPPVGSRVYELTDWGGELEPIVTQLGRWGSRSPSLRHDAERSVDSLVLSLRSLFDPRAARGFRATVALRIGDDRFSVRIADGWLQLARGEADRPDAAVEADARTLAAVIHGDRDLADALQAGDVKIEGRIAAVERFVTLFPLPEPATPRSVLAVEGAH